MDYICQICGEIVGPSIADKNLHLLYKHRSEYNKSYRTGKLGNLRLSVFIPFISSLSEDILTSDSKNKYVKEVPNKRYKLFCDLIYKKRGYRTDEEHNCSCCLKSSTPIWRYNDDNGGYIYFCLKCKDKIKPTRQFINIIPTPMGGKLK